MVKLILKRLYLKIVDKCKESQFFPTEREATNIMVFENSKEVLECFGTCRYL